VHGFAWTQNGVRAFRDVQAVDDSHRDRHFGLTADLESPYGEGTMV
jgi:hypothetical protein